MSKVTQLRDSSLSGLCLLHPDRDIPQAAWRTRFVLLLFAGERLLPPISSRNQKPEPLHGVGKYFRLQGGQGRPLRGGDTYSKP